MRVDVRAILVVVLLVALGCQRSPADRGADATREGQGSSDADSARSAFGAETAALLLDTQLHELRGQLSVKVRNTNPDDPEAPLVDRPVPHPADPGPHTYLGVLHAELGALRAALGDSLPVTVEGDRVFVGRPEVLILGHRHGTALYVPVKLFARNYGAYVRINCPLANCGDLWPQEILLYMRRAGYTSSAGVLEGYIEGLLDSVDVRKLPTG